MSRHATLDLESAPVSDERYDNLLVLGHQAVHAEEQAAYADRRQQYWQGVGADDRAVVAGLQAESHMGQLENELHSTRVAIGSLAPWAKERLEGYLSQHIGGIGTEHIGHRTLADWLADPVRGANDQQLFNFLHSHVTFVREQQRDPKVREAIRQAHVRVAENVRQGVDDGRYSDHALKVLPKLFETPVYISDMLQVGGRGKGYLNEQRGYMAIAHAKKGDIRSRDSVEKEIQEAIKETIPHEDDHVLFGHWEASWFREAMAEYDALSQNDGKFYAIRPGARAEEDSYVYPDVRELVATICEEGDARISLRLVTRAHTSAGPDSTEWKALMGAFDKAWNIPHMYERVTTRIAQVSEENAREHPEWTPSEIRGYAVLDIIEQLRKDRRI